MQTFTFGPISVKIALSRGWISFDG